MHIRIGTHHIPLPDARWLRIGLGILLVIGGLTSILPVFGIWMLPLGIFLLAIELPFLKPMKDFIQHKAKRWFGLTIKKEP